MKTLEVLGGPAAWLAAEMNGIDAWKIELNAAQRAELLEAVAAVEQTGAQLASIRRTDVTLPTMAELLQRTIDELMEGRGFVLLRALPIEGMTEHQAECLSWIIGIHIGIPIRQGPAGNLVTHVRDQGIDPAHPHARGYQHSGRIGYHTDSPDVVGLVCIRPAKRGGVSTIVSSVAVHDEIVRTRPDVAAVLSEVWWHDRRSGDGPESFFQCPIYAANDDGKLFAYYGPDYIRSASRGPGVPQLTVEQLEAMEVLETLNNDPRFVLNMDFQPGDLQLLNNYTIMHARTEYEDYPDPTRKRDLIRLWLTIDRDLGLPASIKDRGLTLRTVAFEEASASTPVPSTSRPSKSHVGGYAERTTK